MAEWKYDEACETIVAWEDDEASPDVIALHVAPEHGPTLAMAPRMLALIRQLNRSEICPPCTCDVCVEARAILSEIDRGYPNI